jgi:alkylation response protein AidB-like acyl-CoA dehydrogenase
MRFEITEEQRLFRDTVRDLLRVESSPAVVRASWASESGRSPTLWAKLAEMGVVGATIPEAYGGLGRDALDFVVLLEEAGRAALAEPLLETTVAAALLRDAGSEELRARWLPDVAAGRAILTSSVGTAPFVADAHVADLLLLEHGAELHAVARGEVTPTREASVDGARRLHRCRWEPSARTRIADGETARAALDRARDLGALGTAAELVGLGSRMIEATVEYTKVRTQFGKPIGSFQAVKHHLVNAHLHVEFARPLVLRAAYSLSHGHRAASLHVSMAKAHASEAAKLAARAALQCHGAIGYTTEHDLHLYMKRAWALATAFGDAASHRERVAWRVLDGNEITGEDE